MVTMHYSILKLGLRNLHSKFLKSDNFFEIEYPVWFLKLSDFFFNAKTQRELFHRFLKQVVNLSCLSCFKAIAGLFYNITDVMMKGPK